MSTLRSIPGYILDPFSLRVVSKIDLLAQSMFPPYFDNQSIPSITSNPWDSKIIRSRGKTWLPMVKVIRSHHRLAIYSAPGELTNKGVLRATVGNLNLSTNPLEIYECDAPVSKKNESGK